MFANLTEGQARILAAARKLVKRRGYPRVSLRDIAAESRYSPAGLYAHFPGRDAIFDTLADCIRGELATALEQAAATEEDPQASLLAIGLAYVAFAQKHPAEFDLLFRYTKSRSKSPSDRRSPAFELLRKVTRRALPDASDERIDLVCLGFWAAAHGFASLRTTHLAGFPGDWDAWTREALRLQIAKVVCAAE